jgi:hypothetical protein
MSPDAMADAPVAAVPKWAWFAVAGVLLLAFLRLAAFHGLPPRGTDDQYYFAQARSLVLDRDLDLRNELGTLTPRPENVHLSTDRPWHEPTATGQVSIKYPVGTAILQAPFVAAAHAVALLGRACGVPWNANGYEAPYYVAWGCGNLAWALVALVFAQRLLRARCALSPWSALLVALLAFGCGPLAYHTIGDPYMAHVPSAALVTVLLACTLSPGRSAAAPFVAGLVAGLAIATRPTNLVWASALLLPLWGRSRWHGPASRNFLAVASGGLLGCLPQLLAAWSVYGSPLHYTYGSEGWSWPPFLAENLIHARAGLFAWNPLWLPALLVALCGRVVPVVLRIAALALVLWNSTWWCHWWGDTFGGRAYASLFCLVALGLGELTCWLRTRAAAVGALARALGAVARVAVLVGAAAWSGYMLWRMETMLPQQRATQGLWPGPVLR